MKDLSIREFAKQAGYSEATVRRRMRSLDITGVSSGKGKATLLSEQDQLALIEDGEASRSSAIVPAVPVAQDAPAIDAEIVIDIEDAQPLALPNLNFSSSDNGIARAKQQQRSQALQNYSGGAFSALAQQRIAQARQAGRDLASAELEAFEMGRAEIIGSSVQQQQEQ